MFMDVLNYSGSQVTSCKYVMYIYSLNKLFIGKYSRHISFISTKQLCIKKVYSCSHEFPGVKWACTIRPAVENVSVLQFQQPVLKREVYFSLICLRRLSTNKTFFTTKKKHLNSSLPVKWWSFIRHYVTGCGDIRSKSERFLATQTPAANKPRFTRRFL